MIQTPYTDFEETVYRYRFQGTIFADREGFASSADYGVSFRTAFPQNYGEVIAGLYNGDTYTRAEPNDQKSFRMRATVRPFPGPGLARGLRVTAYVDRDHTVQGRRAQPLHRERALRAQVRERLCRLPQGDRPDQRAR